MDEWMDMNGIESVRLSAVEQGKRRKRERERGA
jgi:hypothetical protein